MTKLFANSGYPDQTPNSAASDLGLHCLPTINFGVSNLKRVKLRSAHSKIFFIFLNIDFFCGIFSNMDL